MGEEPLAPGLQRFGVVQPQAFDVGDQKAGAFDRGARGAEPLPTVKTEPPARVPLKVPRLTDRPNSNFSSGPSNKPSVSFGPGE